MSREEAHRLLGSADARLRLRAARWFAKNAELGDFEALRAALDRPSDTWTQNAVRAAIASLDVSGEKPATAEVASGAADTVPEDIYAEAVEETTGRLVHELEPIVGALKLVAQREISHYALSNTATQISRLENFLSALDGLRRASAAPTMREFDLDELVRRVATAERGEGDVEIQFGGQTHLIVMGDPTLVELALANGVRNALEATRGVELPEPIVITWGDSNTEQWVAVVDSGRGIPTGKAESMFEIGTTSKRNHLGMGLALAKQSVTSLRGKIILRPRFPKGVQYRFSWPKPEVFR